MLELVGEVLGDAGDVVAEAASPLRREGRSDDAEVSVGLAVKYTATGKIGAPVRSARVAGPAGSVVRSPKNSTSTPPPPMLRSD